MAELRDGQEVPFPDGEVNVFDESRPSECLVGVQSVVVDPAGKLWLQDRTDPSRAAGVRRSCPLT